MRPGAHREHYWNQTFNQQDQYREAAPIPTVNQTLKRFRMCYHNALLEAADLLMEGEPIETFFDQLTPSVRIQALLLGGAIDIAKAKGWVPPRT